MKQGWHLLMQPISLVGQIFKAKYYLNLGFLSAQLGLNSSFAWRIIWSARRLLEKGLRWKVGSGRRISLWDEYWLPGPVPQRIQPLR